MLGSDEANKIYLPHKHLRPFGVADSYSAGAIDGEKGILTGLDTIGRHGDRQVVLPSKTHR